MSDMAKRDPTEFESTRLVAIEELIASVPEDRQGKLRCLQWRIDQERRISSTPLEACIRISNMMWDRLAGDDGLLEQIKSLKDPDVYKKKVAAPRFQAEVIPFPPNGKTIHKA